MCSANLAGLGYAEPVKEHTPRRALEDVLIKE